MLWLNSLSQTKLNSYGNMPAVTCSPQTNLILLLLNGDTIVENPSVDAGRLALFCSWKGHRALQTGCSQEPLLCEGRDVKAIIAQQGLWTKDYSCPRSLSYSPNRWSILDIFALSMYFFQPLGLTFNARIGIFEMNSQCLEQITKSGSIYFNKTNRFNMHLFNLYFVPSPFAYSNDLI